jgi:hypothetical protein
MCNLRRIMHFVSLPVLSRLSRLNPFAVGTSWPSGVGVPLITIPTNVWSCNVNPAHSHTQFLMCFQLLSVFPRRPVDAIMMRWIRQRRSSNRLRRAVLACTVEAGKSQKLFTGFSLLCILFIRCMHWCEDFLVFTVFAVNLKANCAHHRLSSQRDVPRLS